MTWRRHVWAAGVAESILIGILPLLASDLRVSVSVAGPLTALFSFAFAVGGLVIALAGVWLTPWLGLGLTVPAALCALGAYAEGRSVEPSPSTLTLAARSDPVRLEGGRPSRQTANHGSTDN